MCCVNFLTRESREQNSCAVPHMATMHGGKQRENSFLVPSPGEFPSSRETPGTGCKGAPSRRVGLGVVGVGIGDVSFP